MYRSDSDGQISMMDNLRKGAQLVGEAQDLMAGGFRFEKLGEAREVFAGATRFFHGLKHMGEQEEEGLQGGKWCTVLPHLIEVADVDCPQANSSDNTDLRTRW